MQDMYDCKYMPFWEADTVPLLITIGVWYKQ